MSEPNPWDEYAADWDDDPDVRAYAAAAFQSLIDVLDSQGAHLEGAVVCDFGCGSGLLTEHLAGPARRVDAVDTSGGHAGPRRQESGRAGMVKRAPIARTP